MKAVFKVEDKRHRAVLSVSHKSKITSIKLALSLPLKPASINNFPVVLHSSTAEKTELRVPSTCRLKLCACKCGIQSCKNAQDIHRVYRNEACLSDIELQLRLHRMSWLKF